MCAVLQRFLQWWGMLAILTIQSGGRRGFLSSIRSVSALTLTSRRSMRNTVQKLSSSRCWGSSTSSSSSNAYEATTVEGVAPPRSEDEKSAEATAKATAAAPELLQRVKTLHAEKFLGQTIVLKGWVRTIRKQKTLAFVQLNDGSNLAGIQAVLNFDDLSEASRQAIEDITTGAAVSITGLVVESPKSGQAVELVASEVELIGTCPADTYPLAKKRHSLEYLRQIAHLRPRTNSIAAIARVRSQLAAAIHTFFQSQGFVYLHTPLITASDCEGAGEMFRVTTLNLDQLSSLPRKQDDKKQATDGVDYTKDFFGKPAYLTVSGQLGAETHACALGDVYTFGPTFRAENSQTTRHLAEFHMVEPEMAFTDLTGAMDNAESMLQSVVNHVLKACREDLEFFQKFYDDKLIARLERLASQPFARVSYREAITLLQEEIAKDSSKWQFPDVSFGTDLATEHERWLAESKYDSAVFVYNYPKAIKAFYMKDNDADGGETVNAMDLLVPGVGELVGGSQREDRLSVLEQKMVVLDLDPKDYWWYLDLRRFGSVPHSGYGLGFERLVSYVCGIENIREAIAFPRYPGNAEF